MNKLETIFEWGMYLFFFLLPWQTRWIIKAGQLNGGANEYLTYSLYGSDVLLVLLLVVFAIYKFSTIKNLDLKKFLVSFFCLAQAATVEIFILNLVYLFAVISLISIFFATNKILALYIFVRLLLGFGLVWLIANFKDKLKLIWWLVIGLVLPSWLAVAQFLMQNTWANKWLGLARQNPELPGVSVIEIYQRGQLPERWLRAYGSFDHPNILGGVMVIGLLLALYFLTRWFKDEAKIKERLGLYLIIASLAAGSFVSFSRGAWLALIIGLLIWLIFLLWQKGYQALKPWLLGVSIVVIIFLTFLGTYHDLVGMRLGGQGRLEQQSNTERVSTYKEAWQLIKTRPWFGVGLGNYTLALAKQIPKQPSYFYQPTHNVFLLIFVETGIFNLTIFICIYLGSLFLSFNNKNYIGLALLSAILVMLQVDHWWWSLHFGIFFSLIILTLVYNFASNNKQL